jgi:hypothetical protein
MTWLISLVYDVDDDVDDDDVMMTWMINAVDGNDVDCDDVDGNDVDCDDVDDFVGF